MLTVCLQATAGAHDSNGELYRVCVCVYSTTVTIVTTHTDVVPSPETKKSLAC